MSYHTYPPPPPPPPPGPTPPGPTPPGPIPPGPGGGSASVLSIQPTFPIFTDIDGQPLENGYIFIGQANQNPITNPISVFFNPGLTVLAGQPIRTIGGYPANAGTPGRLYVNSDYSIQVQNKNGSVVYSSPTATERYSDVVVSAVNAEDVIYDPPFTAAVQTNVEAKLSETVSVKDFGAVGDGVTNDAAACLAANNATDGFSFPAGTYFINTSITLTKPITMMLGAQFLIASGRVLTINAPVYAGSREFIFDGASGSVAGTLGNVDLCVDWFGAVPDSSISATPTGTDSGIAINKALVAANNGNTKKGVVKLNQGVYLTETPIVSPTSGVTIEGTGKYSTSIVTKSTYTGSVITLSGAGGPASILRGININSAIGGSYIATTGINANTNGIFISDVWVSGFLIGILINNTEVFLDNFVCEFNVTGVSVKRQSVTISNGVTFANQAEGILFSDVPVANANRVVVSNVRSSFDVAVGFYATNSNGITLTGCAVNSDSAGSYSDSGYRIDGTSSDIILNGCNAYIVTQKTTSNGFFVTDASTDIQIKDCSAEHWQIGFKLLGGGNTSISDCQSTNNFLHGIQASNFQNISIINNQCFANGSAAADDAGIRVEPSAAGSRLLVANNISSATGGATQDYGIYVTNNTASIFGLIAVNIAQSNNVANILVDGTSSGNITVSTNITV